MSKVDITKLVLDMHEKEILEKLVAETKLELAGGTPDDVQVELDLLLQRAKDSKSEVRYLQPTMDSVNDPHFYAETELLAAAGQSLGSWFAQPIHFAGAGFVLDIRKVLNTEGEVDVYITPNDPLTMSNALNAFKGCSVELTIASDGTTILIAELYIDESGAAAEGSGMLVDTGNTCSVMGKLSIDIRFRE